MKTSARWLTALALGAALLIVAPLVYAGSGGNDRGFGGKHRSEWTTGGPIGAASAAVTIRYCRADQQPEADLFEEGRPERRREDRGVSGLSGDAAWSGSTSGPPPASSTASATRAASTDRRRQRAGDLRLAAQRRPRRDLLRRRLQPDRRPPADRQRHRPEPARQRRHRSDTSRHARSATRARRRGDGVTAAAYTNNDADPNTATTLYDIDSMLDQVVIQSPPNAGRSRRRASSGVDAGPAIGFDIYSTVRSGTTVDVRASPP